MVYTSIEPPVTAISLFKEITNYNELMSESVNYSIVTRQKVQYMFIDRDNRFYGL